MEGVRLDLIIYTPIIRAFCDLIDWIIDPLYNQISFVKSFTKHISKPLYFQ
jgi:hypothetical protein